MRPIYIVTYFVMKEVRKWIENYDGYFVSNLWKVKSTKYNEPRILKPNKDRKGYLYVNLCSWGVCKMKRIHRLVMLSFIVIDSNRHHVNHIDWKKWNNELSNLEWCTILENNRHAIDELWFEPWKTARKRVAKYSTGWKYLWEYESCAQAWRELWLNRKCIGECAGWREKTAYWFVRKYI